MELSNPTSAVLKTGNLGRCVESLCEAQGVVVGFCRLHYIKNWARIKAKQQILADGLLQKFVDEFIAKYSDKLIEAIRQDLSTLSNFERIVEDLGLMEDEEDSTVFEAEDTSDEDDESSDVVLDSMGSGARRDDDEAEVYI